MDARVQEALRTDRVIDITTTGRKSGREIRKEMWFHNVDGVVYITGTPGRRDWYANMVERPGFTFHLKESIAADLAATAYPITDDSAKRAVLEPILERLERTDQINTWVAASPLVRVEFDES